MIRSATRADLPALAALEQRCFATDRLSERSFRHFLSRGRAEVVVAEDDSGLAGYALVAFHRGTSLARLYSLAVDPARRGRGLARRLLEEAERRAVERGAVAMRLEVRPDNGSALELYRQAGYRPFRTVPDYYEDNSAALRMEKRLAPHLSPELNRVPYYPQTLEFTCGPASLMMAMAALKPGQEMSRHLEMRLWREATTIFMTSGLGGCGPLGLALAAWRRGFAVEVAVSDETGLFVDSVRSEEKKEVIRLVHEDLLHELQATDVALRQEPFTTAELRERIAAGAVPIVLISSYRLTGQREPHWIVLAGFDERFVYVHDPYVDVEDGRTPTDCIGIPIPDSALERMMRMGRRKDYAAVIVAPRPESEGEEG